MLRNVLPELNIKAPIVGMEVPDEETGKRLVFARLATIGFNDVDVDPSAGKPLSALSLISPAPSR